jgi:hypothetical protein
MVEHRYPPSDWAQGAIGIVRLPDGQGQAGGGWHIVFWQSETEWDRSLSIDFCPYCGANLVFDDRIDSVSETHFTGPYS